MNLKENGDRSFKRMCDELVLEKEYFDIIDDFDWLNSEAFKRGISTYEFIFQILHKYDTDIKAKEWLKNKN